MLFISGVLSLDEKLTNRLWLCSNRTLFPKQAAAAGHNLPTLVLNDKKLTLKIREQLVNVKC
jgi:hypothetical protein